MNNTEMTQTTIEQPMELMELNENQLDDISGGYWWVVGIIIRLMIPATPAY